MDFSAESQASREEKPETAVEPTGEASQSNVTPLNSQSSAAPTNGAPPIPTSVTRAGDPSDAPKEAAKEPEKPKDVELPKVAPIPSSALVILPPEPKHFETKFETKKYEAKEETAAPPPRKVRRSAWRTTASRAAIALIVFGCAFVAGERFLGIRSSGSPASQSASATQNVPANQSASAATSSGPMAPVQVAQGAQGAQSGQPGGDLAEMRRDTQALTDEIHSLESRFQSLQATVQAQTPQDFHGLKKSIDGLKASLEAAKSASDASIAQLSGKLDRLEHGSGRITEASLDRGDREGRSSGTDPKAIQATLDRAARGDSSATGSIQLGSKPQLLTPPQPKKTPQFLSNWIVRDVYDGIALVEGPAGAMEVMPGDTIPGAGTVKSIQRRNGGWIVLTSRGIVDYDHD